MEVAVSNHSGVWADHRVLLGAEENKKFLRPRRLSDNDVPVRSIVQSLSPCGAPNIIIIIIIIITGLAQSV